MKFCLHCCTYNGNPGRIAQNKKIYRRPFDREHLAPMLGKRLAKALGIGGIGHRRLRSAQARSILTYMSNRHKTLEELCIGQQIGGGHILAQASVKGASEDK